VYFAFRPEADVGLAPRRGGGALIVEQFDSLIWIKCENPEISYADSATIGEGESREKDEHDWSSSSGSRDIERRPDFGSVVAREGLVGIIGQCLCPSGKTVNCNERRWRRAENGTAGSAPLRSRRYLPLGGSDPRCRMSRKQLDEAGK